MGQVWCVANLRDVAFLQGGGRLRARAQQRRQQAAESDEDSEATDEDGEEVRIGAVITWGLQSFSGSSLHALCQLSIP